jgi:hypothetical protein
MTHKNPTADGVKDDKKKRRSSKRRKSRARSRSVEIDRSGSREKRQSKKDRKHSRSRSRNKDLTSRTDEEKVRSKRDGKMNVSTNLGKEAGSEPSLQGFPCAEKDVYLYDQEQPSVLESNSGRQQGRLSVYQQQKSERRSIMSTAQEPSRWDILIYRARCCLKCLLRFRALKFFQVVCAVYICIITFKGGLLDADTGMIVDQESDERTNEGVILVNGTERAIVAESKFQVIAILIARISAWFMYPSKFLRVLR